MEGEQPRSLPWRNGRAVLRQARVSFWCTTSRMSRRQDRVGEQIHRVMSELLTFETQDPRLANLTVSRAEITGDLRHAIIYVLPHGRADDMAEAFAGLGHARDFLRRRLAERLQLQFAPEITFAWDEQNTREEHLQSLLDELSKKE